MTQPEWSREGLRTKGFRGWVQLRSREAVASAPAVPGVYCVVGKLDAPISWSKNCGGWFKGKNPGIDDTRLVSNWVPEAEVLYIGRSGNLHRRLREFADFGLGKAAGHWGGRLLWHLPSPDDLCIGWKVLDTEAEAVLEEKRLIAEFRVAWGKPPFANDPHKDGR